MYFCTAHSHHCFSFTNTHAATCWADFNLMWKSRTPTEREGKRRDENGKWSLGDGCEERNGTLENDMVEMLKVYVNIYVFYSVRAERTAARRRAANAHKRSFAGKFCDSILWWCHHLDAAGFIDFRPISFRSETWRDRWIWRYPPLLQVSALFPFLWSRRKIRRNFTHI